MEEVQAWFVFPIRELILSDDSLKIARQKLKDLGDELGINPTDRARLIEDLENHREVLEPRWVLPAFAKELVSFQTYLPNDLPLIFIDQDRSNEVFSEF